MINAVKRKFLERRLLRLSMALGAMLTALILLGVFLYARVNTLLNVYMEVQGEKQAETLAELTHRQFQTELTALYTVARTLRVMSPRFQYRDVS